jgi:radical SAM/Cys-rich protein
MNHPLAVVDAQREVLRPHGRFEPFARRLAEQGLAPLAATSLEVMQVNVGKLCNQTCKHCHVDAGPDRTEIMSRQTMEWCLAALERTEIGIVDITGGAPEMNPDFRWLVDQVRLRGRHVIDRCNLTILLAPRFEDLPEFLASRQVEIVASLPFYSAAQTDRQRGAGVFDRSIEALRRLNGVGYGRPGSALVLNLVYNPAGAFLPPEQQELEATFRAQLAERYGVAFTSLFTITNQPINRFLEYLLSSGNYEGYMERLIAAFNPAAAERVMCRSMISVGWDGRLYDCDFNQMLALEVNHGLPAHIRDFDPAAFARRQIVTGLHCYACAAGRGSSCGGAVV